MPASIWREKVGQVHVSGYSVIEDRGHLAGAYSASDGFYWFSEVGAGVGSLALIGQKGEIIDWLISRKHSGIRNVIQDLPDIYMGVTEYKPGKRFVGLFPLNDALQAITEGLVALIPGSTLTDVAGGVKDLKENIGKVRKGFSWFSSFKGEKVQKQVVGQMYVKFHYLQDRKMQMDKVAHKVLKFRKVHQILSYLWA